jgi:hypothetical protein
MPIQQRQRPRPITTVLADEQFLTRTALSHALRLL